MNSRTSRPRSPTSPTTTTSAAEPRAIMPSRVDLPMPEPANRPRRWPRPTGMNASIARTPVASGSRIRCRRSGCGGWRWRAGCGSTGTKPSPSKGRPRASSTRPSSSGPGRGSGGRSAAATSQPTCRPKVSPRGISSTRCSRKPTTSARTLKSVRGRAHEAKVAQADVRALRLDDQPGHAGDGAHPLHGRQVAHLRCGAFRRAGRRKRSWGGLRGPGSSGGERVLQGGEFGLLAPVGQAEAAAHDAVARL